MHSGTFKATIVRGSLMLLRVPPRQNAKAGLAMIGLLGILKYPCEIWIYLLNDIKVNRPKYFSR
jgi:hypothetical protein